MVCLSRGVHGSMKVTVNSMPPSVFFTGESITVPSSLIVRAKARPCGRGRGSRESSASAASSTSYDCDSAFGASPSDSIENGEKPSESSSPNEKNAFAGPWRIRRVVRFGNEQHVVGAVIACGELREVREVDVRREHVGGRRAGLPHIDADAAAGRRSDIRRACGRCD